MNKLLIKLGQLFEYMLVKKSNYELAHEKIKAITDDIYALQKSHAALQKTLQFYADAPNYALTRDERGMETTPIFIDAGKRARAALEDKC
jgi:hypothetical protein